MNIKIFLALSFSTCILLTSACTAHTPKNTEPLLTTEKKDLLLNFCLQDTSAYDYTQEVRDFCDCATVQTQQLFSATDWNIFKNISLGSNAKPSLHTAEQLAQFEKSVNAVLATCTYRVK